MHNVLCCGLFDALTIVDIFLVLSGASVNHFGMWILNWKSVA